MIWRQSQPLTMAELAGTHRRPSAKMTVSTIAVAISGSEVVKTARKETKRSRNAPSFIAGMKEGAFRDRFVSFLAVFTTSLPEIATAIVLTVIFALGLRWVPANSAMVNGWDWRQIILPVMTLVLYDFGYVARMTRASMAEVMTSQYIRTAVLKGLPHRRVILRHALRNALIAPFTIIVLQLNFLLSGVVVVEVFFQFAGFGKLLLDAALFGDIYVIQAATLVAVFVAVLSQIISDVGYTFLNPRIRFS